MVKLGHEEVFAVGSSDSLDDHFASLDGTEAAPAHLNGEGASPLVLLQADHIVAPLVESPAKHAHQIGCAHELPLVHRLEEVRARLLIPLVHVLPVPPREEAPEGRLDLPGSLHILSESAA